MKNRLFALCLFWLSFFQSVAQSKGPATAGDSVPTERRFTLQSYIIPAVLIGAGTGLLTHPTREPFTSLDPVSHADEYLRFGPYGLRLALQAAGIKPAVKLGDEVAVTVLSNLIMGGVTGGLKYTVMPTPTNGIVDHSFPSGHTAIAFTGAELLHQAYKHKSPWISIAGYVMATATGVLRVANNAHRWGEVLAGAGIGIASVKISYAVYPVIKRTLSRKRGRSAMR